jgi:hypothetical protein
MIAYTTAPPALDYPYVERTGATYSVGGARWHQVRVHDKGRWDAFQVPRYRASWFAVADTVENMNLWGLPTTEGGGK